MPTSYEVDHYYAEYVASQGATQQALTWLGQAILLYPDDPELYVDLGRWYTKLGHCELAEPLLARATALSPSDANARSGLIICFLHTGRWRAAQDQARAAIAAGAEPVQFRSVIALTDSILTGRRADPFAKR